MTNDRGLAALAKALDKVIDDGFYYRDLYGSRPAEDAAAILGERGVFLPDGLDPDDKMTMDLMEHAIREDQATIATLRAALDGLVRACRAPHGTCRFCGVPLSAMHDDECPVEQAIRAVEPGYAAALAAAKEAGNGEG
jgi:hypothetical protein